MTLDKLEAEEYEIKKEELYKNQVALLNTFLEHGAITKAQYDKSFNDLTEKMGMKKK